MRTGMADKNELYWAYNLPLQVWPEFEIEDDETSPVVQTRIVNYMPRKEQCCSLVLDEDVLGGQTREEFFETAAVHLENLARLMREAAENPAVTVYYHDDGMDGSW